MCFAKNRKQIQAYRENILRIANAVGKGDKMFAARTKPAAKAKYKARQGARKVKDFERAKALEDGSLTPESATLFRVRAPVATT